MDDATVPVTAEWALWGRHTLAANNQLLACSDGAIGSAEFAELIQRYLLPGTIRDLPQLTFAGLRDRDRRTYLAIAIHRGGDRDSSGRDIARTSCFLVPFSELTAGRNPVSYLALYLGFRDIQLPLPEGTPIRAQLTMAPPRPPAHELAMRAAALLTTGRPVCILGARHLTRGDRLEFIDDVAAMLPYGIRGQLSATTWADRSFSAPDYRRLAFSDSPEPPDAQVLTWGESADGPLGDASADAYLSWLRENVPRRAVELARMTDAQGVDSVFSGGGLASRTGGQTRYDPPTAEPVPETASPDTGSYDVSGPAYAPPPPASAPPPAPAGVAVGAPPVTSAARDWVSEAVQSAVRRGLLVFNPPAEMRQGKAERVEVGIARSAVLRETLLDGLRGRGDPQFKEIDTSHFMSVELKGDAFAITPYSMTEQIVADTARWEFDVQPTRAGTQTLIVVASVRMAVSRLEKLGGARRSLPVLEWPIRIRVDVPYSTRRFVANNWQWLIATAVGLGGGIAAWIALFH